MVETMNAFQAIVDNQFVKDVFHDALELQRDLYDPEQVIDIIATPKRKLTELESYLSHCGFSIAHLLNHIEQLCKIPSYIMKNRSNEFTKRYGVTRIDDVTYHYENFIIRYKSTEDRVLQMCNAVFHLGISSTDVNYKLIIDNAHIANHSIYNSIKQLQKTCNLYGSDRNRIIHQHSIMDKDLRKVEFMLNSSRGRNEYSGWAKSRYIKLINEFVEHKAPEMENNILTLFAGITNVIEGCKGEYKEKIIMLRNQ